MSRLETLIDYLLKEDPQYSEMEIPADLQGKRDLFRALRNVRCPRPVSDEFLRFQDEEASPSAAFQRVSSASRISWPPKSPYKPSKIT